jgi:uncharacterized cupin superfamily protein
VTVDTEYAWRSSTQPEEYEPFIGHDGEAVGEVSWLRRSDDPQLLTGMWRCEPSEFDYPFTADETFVVTTGHLRVAVDGGSTLELKSGDTASFVKGTRSVWTVIEAVEKFFIVND